MFFVSFLVHWNINEWYFSYVPPPINIKWRTTCRLAVQYQFWFHPLNRFRMHQIIGPLYIFSHGVGVVITNTFNQQRIGITWREICYVENHQTEKSKTLFSNYFSSVTPIAHLSFRTMHNIEPSKDNQCKKGCTFVEWSHLHFFLQVPDKHIKFVVSQ